MTTITYGAYKHVLLTLVFAFFSYVYAEAASAVIRGSLKDADTGGALEFVSVSISDANGKLVTGSITDIDGAFEIKGVKEGRYKLSCSFMGYETLDIDVVVTPNGKVVNIGEKTMQPDSKSLDEVEVKAKSPQVRFELDRKVFDATQDLAAQTGSASDLLENVPSVDVDADGTISLRGNSSVTIWINGKASGLTTDNQSDILQLIPADNIKQIEVITNPSSKYSPEGTAGIINIVLKDDRMAGYYGSVKAGVDTRKGYQLSVNMNASNGVVEGFVNLSRRVRKMEGGNLLYRENLADDGSVLSTLNQDGESDRTHENWFARMGATWHITKNDDLGATFAGMKGGMDNNNKYNYTSTQIYGVETPTTLYTSERTTSANADDKFYSVGLTYDHKWSEVSKLAFALTNSRFNIDRESVFEQSYNYADSATSNTYQFQPAKVDDKSWEVQLDYETKFADVVNFSAGYKATLQDNSGPTETYTGTSASDAVLDKTLYNDFTYKQDIHAAYLTVGGRVSQLSYMVGLRGEYWKFKTRSLSYSDAFEGTSPDEAERDFFKLFPSAFLSYTLPNDNELQVNYTRRLRRPWGGQLNSFRDISDAQNISFGNPELTPEYSNSFELNYIKTWESGQMLSSSLYYRTTDDVMQRIRFMVDGVIYQTQENVAHRMNTGLEVVGKNRFGTVFDLTTTLNMYYSVIDAFTFHPDVSWLGDGKADVVVTGDKDEDFTWNIRAIAGFNLPKSITLQATGDYSSRQMIAQGYRKPVYKLDLGAKKSFLKDKLIVNINGRNVLNSRKFHSVTESAGFRQDSENWRGKRVFNLTVTWNFGNMNMNKKRGPERENEGGNYDTYSSEE
ncbi:MAG: TonB-dependent receptor [Bacteroidales bacterium]|jgi:outer membrane receptor protein involved in Fe transport|nr:TonB-dependent receptor [Bacteroidales bacterium]